MQARIPAITRKDLHAIGCASRAVSVNPLPQVLAELQASGLYTEASADEIENFDNALDEAEGKLHGCDKGHHNWGHFQYFNRCDHCGLTE